MRISDWSSDVCSSDLDGETKRHINALIKMQRLERDQRLVVIHAERDVISTPYALMEHGIGGKRAGDVDAFRPKLFHCGNDDVDFLHAQCSILTGMRIEASYDEPGTVNRKILLQPFGGCERPGLDEFNRERLRHLL